MGAALNYELLQWSIYESYFNGVFMKGVDHGF